MLGTWNFQHIYETQMKAIFHDAFIFDVVMGRALRTAPVAGEAQIITDKRAIYDECSLQAYSVIIRTFTTENSGFCDSSYWSSLTMGLQRIKSHTSKLPFTMAPNSDRKRDAQLTSGRLKCEMPVPFSLPMGTPSQNPKRLSYFENVSFVRICNRASFFPPVPRLMSNWL
jgi:hypothetical protein